jgi:hypothetical protein
MHTSQIGKQCLLPKIWQTSGREISFPVARNSTKAAEKMAVRKELVHNSFHLQNWLGGMSAAIAALVI